MPRETGYNFVGVATSWKKKEPEKMTVTITKKGQIFFSTKYMRSFVSTPVFVKFYVDSDRRLLGWQLKEKIVDLSGLNRREHRLLKKLKCGLGTLQIKGIFDLIGEIDKTYKKLEVEEYVDKIYGKIQFIRVPLKSRKIEL